METVRVDILNPKARELLQNLDELNLISIEDSSKKNFSKIVKKIRSKSDSVPGPQEIAREVETVRSKRYEKKG